LDILYWILLIGYYYLDYNTTELAILHAYAVSMSPKCSCSLEESTGGSDGFTEVKKSRGRKKKMGASQPAGNVNAVLDNMMDLMDPTDCCVYCASCCSADTGVLCPTCSQWFHCECLGVDASLITTFTKLGPLLGWECEACKLEKSTTIKQLQSQLSSALQTIATLSKQTRNGSSGTAPSNYQGAPPHLPLLTILNFTVMC